MSAEGYASVEAELEKHGVYYATTYGDSMAPLFHTREKVIELKVPTGRLSRFDVPLVKRQNGKYVLHRVIKVLPDGYVTRGDNRRKNDPFVPEGEVIAVLTGYYVGKRYVSLDSLRYRAYVFFWGRPNPCRAVWLWMRAAVKRLLGRK